MSVFQGHSGWDGIECSFRCLVSRVSSLFGRVVCEGEANIQWHHHLQCIQYLRWGAPPSAFYPHKQQKHVGARDALPRRRRARRGRVWVRRQHEECVYRAWVRDIMWELRIRMLFVHLNYLLLMDGEVYMALGIAIYNPPKCNATYFQVGNQPSQFIPNPTLSLTAI